MCKLSALPPPCHPQLLNCIMDMVEKTRRSLTVLRRCQEADREELNYWIRRYSDAEELKKGTTSGQSRQQSPAAQENATPGRGSHIVYIGLIYIFIFSCTLSPVRLDSECGVPQGSILGPLYYLFMLPPGQSFLHIPGP